MKKAVRVLTVIAVILGLGVAGAFGYIWYKDNHIFVEDAVYSIHAESLDLREEDISVEHYDTVHAQLPECDILWSVPFQNQKFSSDSTSLTITKLSEKDIERLAYFTDLKTIDATACDDYTRLEVLQAVYPNVDVQYQVQLGSASFDPDATELVLETEQFDFDTMMENLKHLQKVTAITLKKNELPLEKVDELKTAYENIAFTWTVELLGQEYEGETTELDLSAMTPEDVETVAAKLVMLPQLTSMQLMNAEGTSQLELEHVKILQEAAPNVLFHYSFEFYGVKISTADEQVYIKNQKIGDEGLDEVRAVLNLLPNCKRFVLDNCKTTNEEMAKLREEYRDKTKVVWRVSFGKGTELTDVEIVKSTHHLVANNCDGLRYCEDIQYLDVGHNEMLTTLSFVEGMPKLKAIIASGSPIKDLEALKNCPELEFLELAFCGYIEDLTPLKNCTKLQLVNVSFTKVADLTPLDELPITNMIAKGAKTNAAEEARFDEQHPDCWTEYDGQQPYGPGWRYAENNKDYLPYYEMLRLYFDYDKNPNWNHDGCYLSDRKKAE